LFDISLNGKRKLIHFCKNAIKMHSHPFQFLYFGLDLKEIRMKTNDLNGDNPTLGTFKYLNHFHLHTFYKNKFDIF